MRSWHIALCLLAFHPRDENLSLGTPALALILAPSMATWPRLSARPESFRPNETHGGRCSLMLGSTGVQSHRNTPDLSSFEWSSMIAKTGFNNQTRPNDYWRQFLLFALGMARNVMLAGANWI